MNINLDPSKLAAFNCPVCQGETFENVVLLRFVPALLVGAPADGLMGIPKFKCSHCGHVVEDRDVLQFKKTTPGLVSGE